MNVYEHCPVVENDGFLLRLVTEQDCDDLLKVYSDKAAVPLFNSDNCNGDDFYYTTRERMLQGIQMWLWSYAHGWFVRWSVVDKNTGCAVGTVELFRREGKTGEDEGVLRLDLRSDYEQRERIGKILPLVFPDAFTWFGCQRILTKAKPVAKERIRVLKEFGFVPQNQPLFGHDGTGYADYWICIL